MRRLLLPPQRTNPPKRNRNGVATIWDAPNSLKLPFNFCDLVATTPAVEIPEDTVQRLEAMEKEIDKALAG